jgi:hypothetical protein
MESKNVVTFKRIANGEFESYLNGEKTEFRIYNGCLGLDGRDTPNIYMVAKLDTPTKIQGTLQMCKKSITHWLTKRAKEAAQAAPAQAVA